MPFNFISIISISILSFVFSNCETSNSKITMVEKPKIETVAESKVENIDSTFYYLEKPEICIPDKNGRVWLLDVSQKKVLVHIDSVLFLQLYDDGNNQRFPIEVLKFKNLRFLWLGMRGFKTVPKEIAKLTKLESLDFQHGFLESLPEEIGDLKNLEDLTLLFCMDFKKLPNRICELENLKRLQIAHTLIDTSKMPTCLKNKNGLILIYKREIDGEANPKD